MKKISVLINIFNNFLRFPKNGFTRKHVDDFMYLNFKYIKENSKVLDIGAGYKPYAKYFQNCLYESCDHADVLSDIGDKDKYQHTFYCDITKNIPVNDNNYDIVICNEVLEHINEPSMALKEIYRVLKSEGKLFITTTQCHGLHQEPHNYFNYLSYGLEHILKKNNFHIIELKPLGGIYHLLGKIMHNIIENIFIKNKLVFRILFYPVEFFVRIILLIISLFLYSIDFLDKDRKWTINYGCICKK